MACVIAFRGYRAAYADSTRKIIIFRPRRRRSLRSLKVVPPRVSVARVARLGCSLPGLVLRRSLRSHKVVPPRGASLATPGSPC